MTRRGLGEGLRRAHNSRWPPTISFRGLSFQGPSDLFRRVQPRPSVGQATFMGRLKKARADGDLSDSRLAEALYLPALEYRGKYGVRKTWVDLPGRRATLEEIFTEARERVAISFRTLWQRVRRLRLSDCLDAESIEDALTLSSADWRTFYGGGRRRSFEYAGDLYREHRGRTFRSLASFLKIIGNYEDRSTIWSRLKAGWGLDAALIEPVVDEVHRTGSIYKATRRRTGQVYVGLTILTLEGRWAHHVALARKGGTGKLSRAIAEDGPEGFDLEVLECGIEGSEALERREEYWVRKLGALGPNGLNTAQPGGLGLRRGKRTRYEGEEFGSLAEAAAVLGKRRGLAPHVVARRLSAGKELPARARKRSRHPDAGSKLYRIWLALKKRHPGEVDQPWLEDYDAFKSCVAPSRVEGHELVRKDSSRRWGPENFEWVSTQEKILRIHGRQLTVSGVTYPSLRAAAAAFGVVPSTLKYRLAKGLTPEEALGLPLGVTSYRKSGRSIVFDGSTFRSKRQAILHIARTRGISEGQARSRLERALLGGIAE